MTNNYYAFEIYARLKIILNCKLGSEKIQPWMKLTFLLSYFTYDIYLDTLNHRLLENKQMLHLYLLNLCPVVTHLQPDMSSWFCLH